MPEHHLILGINLLLLSSSSSLPILVLGEIDLKDYLAAMDKNPDQKLVIPVIFKETGMRGRLEMVCHISNFAQRHEQNKDKMHRMASAGNFSDDDDDEGPATQRDEEDDTIESGAV